MASLPYPLNRLYTHIVCVIATTQSACILMSVWVWQGCHTLLQIPILLFFKTMFFCSSVFSTTTCSHVPSVFSNNNMFSCPHVFKTTTCSHVLLSFQQKHVLMFFCLFNKNMFSCPHVFSTTTCSHVLMSFQQQHVLMFSCLSKTTCSSVFPQKEPCSPVQLCLYVAKKKRLRATLPAVKP